MLLAIDVGNTDSVLRVFNAASLSHSWRLTMQAGLFCRYVDMLQGIVRRMRGDLCESAAVVTGGGLTANVASETDIVEYIDPEVTRRGLRIAWDGNQ